MNLVLFQISLVTKPITSKIQSTILVDRIPNELKKTKIQNSINLEKPTTNLKKTMKLLFKLINQGFQI
jgi:hypothetical protein